MNEAKVMSTRNVCAIRCNGLWWQRNNEHGCGWTDRIRQTWTAREAMLEFDLIAEEFKIDPRQLEIIEMIPGEQVPYTREPKEQVVDWTKPIQFEDGTPCKLAYESDDGSTRPMLIVYRTSTGQDASLWCRRDGRGASVDSRKIINAPAVPEPAKVEWPTGPAKVEVFCETTSARHNKGLFGVAISNRDGERVAILDSASSSMMVFDNVEEAMCAGWSFDRWELGRVTG